MKQIQQESLDILKELKALSNLISNFVWMAENNEESDVNDNIHASISIGKHLLDDIEKKYKDLTKTVVT